MRYIKRGAHNLFVSIRKNKILFVSLVLLQFVFLMLLVYFFIIYQVRIINDARSIVDPLQEANYDALSIQEGQPFLQDALQIIQSYQALVRNLIEATVIIVALFLLFNGSLWVLSHRMIEKKGLKETFHQWIKFSAASVIVYGLLAMASYFYLRNLILGQADPEFFNRAFKVVLYIFLVIYYFLLSAFSMIYTSSWKLFLQRTYLVSLKKAPLAFLLVMVNAAVLAGGVYLIYLSMQPSGSFLLMMLSTFLFITLIVITRLFWISTLRELLHEKSNS